MLSLLLFMGISSSVFATAGTPIVGVPVGLDHDPGGIKIQNATTDKAGKFSFKLEEGMYNLNLSYAQVAKILSGTNKNYAANPAAFSINLMFIGQSPDGNIFDRWGILTKNSTHIIINRKTGAISLTVPKGGGIISATLTYTAVRKSEKVDPTQKKQVGEVSIGKDPVKTMTQLRTTTTTTEAPAYKREAPAETPTKK